MPSYEYIDKLGVKKTVEAGDANTALSSAKDIASNSGVMLSQKPSPIVAQDTSSIRNQYKNDSATLAEEQRKSTQSSTGTKYAEQDQSQEESGGLYDGLEDQKKKIKSDIDKTYDPLISQLEGARKRASATANSLISGIRETFELRKKEMTETNRKQLQFEESVGLRAGTGRARYAPTMQQQILTDEEQQGIARISNLDVQMNDLIIKAEQAKDANDLRALNDSIALYKEKNNQVQTEIKNLYSQVKDEENARIQRAKAERDAINAQIKQNTDLSETLAPSLNKYLDQIPTQQGKEDFISAYAKKMGITDEEFLFSALEDYGITSTKAELDIQAKRQSIYNSQQSNYRANESSQRAQEKANEYQIDVENIVQGAGSLSDVSSTNKPKVKADLISLGYFKEEPPVWFKDKIESEEGANLPYDTLKSQWEDHRSKATQ